MPQLPPRTTCHASIPSSARSSSMSAISCGVSLPSRQPLGNERAAAALVEEEHSVVVGVEEASVPLETAGAGAAVQEECWCAGGRAVLLVVELVHTAGHAVLTCAQRLLNGIERPQGDRRVEQSYPAAEPSRPPFCHRAVSAPARRESGQ